MYKNLISGAKDEGFEKCVVRAIVLTEEEVLLIEDPVTQVFGVPEAEIRSDETIPQALNRAIIFSVGHELQEVKQYLTHYDHEKERVFYFSVKILEPRNVDPPSNHKFAWTDPREAPRYPIREELRVVLDLLRS